MRLRDLELELESICEQGLSDVESVIMRFGHGDCHDLTLALMDTCGFEYGLVVMGERTKTIIHSCVMLNDKTTLDAYGVNTVEKTSERYGELSRINLGEKALVKCVNRNWFAKKGLEPSDLESAGDILAEFQVVLDYIGLTLGSFKKKDFIS